MVEYEEFTEERRKAAKLHAVNVLKALLQELEDKWEDEQYETEFLGDLYARMIVSIYLGFNPRDMAEDAEGGALRLMKVAIEYSKDE